MGMDGDTISYHFQVTWWAHGATRWAAQGNCVSETVPDLCFKARIAQCAPAPVKPLETAQYDRPNRPQDLAGLPETKQTAPSGSAGWSKGMHSDLAPIASGVVERFRISSSTAGSSHHGARIMCPRPSASMKPSQVVCVSIHSSNLAFACIESARLRDGARHARS